MMRSTKLWWMSETSLTSKFSGSTSSLEWPLRISAHCKGENTGKSVFFPSFSPYKAPPHESKKKGVFVRKDLFSGNLIKDHEKTSFRQFRAKQAKEGEKRDFRCREQENRFSRLRGRKKGFFGKNTLFLRPRKIISESPKLRSSTGNLHPFLGSFCPLFWRARKRGFSRVFALWAPKKWNIPLISWFWGFARKDLFSPSFSLFALFLAFRPFSPRFASFRTKPRKSGNSGFLSRWSIQTGKSGVFPWMVRGFPGARNGLPKKDLFFRGIFSIVKFHRNRCQIDRNMLSRIKIINYIFYSAREYLFL